MLIESNTVIRLSSSPSSIVDLRDEKNLALLLSLKSEQQKSSAYNRLKAQAAKPLQKLTSEPATNGKASMPTKAAACVNGEKKEKEKDKEHAFQSPPVPFEYEPDQVSSSGSSLHTSTDPSAACSATATLTKNQRKKYKKLVKKKNALLNLIESETANAAAIVKSATCRCEKKLEAIIESPPPPPQAIPLPPPPPPAKKESVPVVGVAAEPAKAGKKKKKSATKQVEPVVETLKAKTQPAATAPEPVLVVAETPQTVENKKKSKKKNKKNKAAEVAAESSAKKAPVSSATNNNNNKRHLFILKCVNIRYAMANFRAKHTLHLPHPKQ